VAVGSQVIDLSSNYNRTRDGSLPKGSLCVVEETPLGVFSEDVTGVLNGQGWWGGYNMPYSQELWGALGYGQAGEQYNMTYEQNPRYGQRS
jgi:hypothetical protein